MSKVMTWVKANLWIVVLSAVILIVLPAGWVASSMWNKSIRTARQKAVDDDRTKLNAVRQISYTVPSVAPGEAPLEFNSAPNDKTIELFEGLRAEQDKQVAGVLQLAQEANSRGHTPLVSGLFPEPSPAERQAKVLEFMGVLVPTKDPANPSAYERLLSSIGAASPPDIKMVITSLEDAKQRERERASAAGNTATELSETEQKELAAALVNQRLALYKAQADQVSVYATMDIFPSLSGDTYPQIPDTRLAQPPRVDTCFVWQCDYWTVQDIFEAVKLANTGPGGKPTMVPESVVKRIVSLRLGPPPWETPSGSEESRATAIDPKTALLTPVFSASVTGRTGGKANQLYDVRRARMSVVVSLPRLPQFFNAVSRSNFMTVVGINLRPVNINDELDQGYYYGPEAVVRADIDIECVWLRNWTAPLMPDEIKGHLGIPVEKPAGEPEGSSSDQQEPAGGKGGGR